MELPQEGLVLRMLRAFLENSEVFSDQIPQDLRIVPRIKVLSLMPPIVWAFEQWRPFFMRQKFHPLEVPDHARHPAPVAFAGLLRRHLSSQEQLVGAEEGFCEGIALELRQVRRLGAVLILVPTLLAEPTEPTDAQPLQDGLGIPGVGVEVAHHVANIVVGAVVWRSRQQKDPVRHGPIIALPEKALRRLRPQGQAVHIPQVVRLVDDDQVKRRPIATLGHQAVPDKLGHPAVHLPVILLRPPRRSEVLAAPRTQSLLPTFALHQPGKRRHLADEQPRPLILHPFDQLKQVRHFHRRLDGFTIPPEHPVIGSDVLPNEGRILRHPIVGDDFTGGQDKDAGGGLLLPEGGRYRE